MEEQRKKREEVLKMKEERRRQKLATMAGKDEFSAVPTQPGNSGAANPSTTTVSPTSRLPEANKPPNTNVHHSPFSRLDGGSSLPQTGSSTVKENSVSPTLRKTVLVKPTPTVQTSVRTIPQAAVGVNRRYKIIIVKNKSGKILEKRRVPIDEPSSGNNHDNNPLGHMTHPPPSSLLQTPARISETVTIENLNMNATEDYVWKLCQMFGPVQEVYPKLQEVFIKQKAAPKAKLQWHFATKILEKHPFPVSIGKTTHVGRDFTLFPLSLNVLVCIHEGAVPPIAYRLVDSTFQRMDGALVDGCLAEFSSLKDFKHCKRSRTE
ncbi:hypothetical protein DAPPUDRAFT_251681 [Daphnia pulex]|uniref:Uncharacterized protein n=1 Tax=Daphnia pulex TaxID=6669 RepID=E9H0X3_DAPPU|nr:hypothetical protein DAPPUDRAFT_251681 [Daphnia pulex]|eukprot:EFX74628.1 hypothetical protein DAPPUDRAFT_251681 [Daphnia pulex]